MRGTATTKPGGTRPADARDDHNTEPALVYRPTFRVRKRGLTPLNAGGQTPLSHRVSRRSEVGVPQSQGDPSISPRDRHPPPQDRGLRINDQIRNVPVP